MNKFPLSHCNCWNANPENFKGLLGLLLPDKITKHALSVLGTEVHEDAVTDSSAEHSAKFILIPPFPKRKDELLLLYWGKLRVSGKIGKLQSCFTSW